MLTAGTYKLKTEFFPALGISEKQYERRKADLLEWLKEFYDYELLPGKPIRIQINTVYGEYQPLPRNLKITQEKLKDYTTFVLGALTNEYTPNSKAKVAREAIIDFSKVKYGHSSPVSVARNWVGPIMEEKGEHTSSMIWVNSLTYEPLDDAIRDLWVEILKKNYISEEEAANAFYKQEQGMDITKEKQSFASALTEFKDHYGYVPVKVYEWRTKKAV